MKTKRHAAALGMLVVLLIAGSGYVHLANASALEQALAYGGSIEPLLSAADHLRAFFMDRDFLLAHGMSVPNVNGMCILILYQALLFNIVEDYRNRTLSSYSLWQYRQSRSRFILSYIKEAVVSLMIGFLCTLAVFGLFSCFAGCAGADILYVTLYLIRLYMLLMGLTVLSRICYLFTGSHITLVLQIVLYIILLFVDNFSMTAFVIMSGSVSEEIALIGAYGGLLALLIAVSWIMYQRKGDIL